MMKSSSKYLRQVKKYLTRKIVLENLFLSFEYE